MHGVMRGVPVSLSRLAPLLFFAVLPLAAAQAQLAPRDSLRILGEAHSAQFGFEAARRLSLPRTQPLDQPACDAVIGRMCYWNEDGSNDDEPDGSSEPATISRARRRLINLLGKLSAQSPADVWIAGQRVRYLVENGDDSAAVTAARDCRAAQWWCDGLRGYALHAAGDYAASEAAFDTALDAMPHDARCKWTDIALLLTDSEREEYQRLPCDARRAAEQRFWKLAQPSYVVRGNDRRTEHFSRVLLAELWASSSNAYGMSWADDMREILIRYGAPSWYAATWPSGNGSSAGTIGHDRRHGFHFAATVDRDNIRWDIHAKAPRERYAAPYIDSVTELNAQFALLKRGDSALVVAVYSSAMPTRNALLGIAPDSGVTMVSRDSASAVYVRRARTAWKGVVAGIEEYDPERRIDARARVWLAPPATTSGAPELSTLVLFAPDTAHAVESLDDALARALTVSELRGTRKVGLYWEVYGQPMRAAASDSAANDSSTAQHSDVVITVTRTDGGVLKWLGQALHLTRGDSPLAMRWHDSGSGDVSARSVVLDLSQLPDGAYRIALSAGPDDVHRTVTWRDIRLR